MVAVVIAGGGASGAAAALAATAAGAEVLVVERTDLLMTGALRAGRMNSHGKIIAAEESKALGGGILFETLEDLAIHHDAELPGEEFTYVYDCGKVEPVTRRMIRDAGIEIIFERRVATVLSDGGRIDAVTLDDGTELQADAFIDTTGSSGGIDVCEEFGKGCVECIYRCPTFGDRISLVAAAGIPERARERPDGQKGAIGSGVGVHKGSIDPQTLRQLEEDGELTIPLPDELKELSKAENQSAPRTRKQMEYLNVTDIGIVAKLTGLAYMPLEDLRTIPGFENAQYESPLSAGLYNRITRVAIAPWALDLRVEGLSNLFCAGEKLGVSGVAEAIATGALAGHNAVRAALGRESVALPRSLGLGEYLAWVRDRLGEPGGLRSGYSLGNGAPVDLMRERGFYGNDPAPMHERVAAAGLTGIFLEQLC